MSHYNGKLWTPNFLIVSSINFILTMIFYLLVVTIAAYAVDEFHATTSQAGLISGIFIVGTLVGRLFTGRVIDSFGHKKMLMLGLILFSIITALYFLHTGITGLILIRFVHGTAFGLAATATGTIVAQTIPASRKGEGIGYYSMSATLGTAIGPFFGLFMSQHTSYDVIFATCFILGIVCLIASFFAKTKQSTGVTTDTERKNFNIAQYIELKALPIAVVTLLVALGYAAVLSFINFYAEERDLVNEASFFFVVYAIAILLTRPFTGKWIDTKGANFVMYPCFIIMGLGLLLLSTAHNGLVLLLSGALIGIGFGNIQSTAQAIAIKLTPAERMGLATSTYFIFLDAGLGFGPSLLGVFIPYTGYGNIYLILGIFVCLLTIVYFLLHGRKDRTLLKIQ